MGLILLGEDIKFDKVEQHFYIKTDNESYQNQLKLPLSVSLQLTRECNLSCEYCSEIGDIPTPSLKNVKNMISRLEGVKRIILTGGEPLIRKDLLEIVKYTKELNFDIVSLATNGTFITSSLAHNLSRLIDYADITLDGPRNIHNKIRGKYDEVIKGIFALKTENIPFSIVSVLFKENVESIFYTCQIADILGATKLKIMTPISKGKGITIASEVLSPQELEEIFQKIKTEKEKNGWIMRISLTNWDKIGEATQYLFILTGMLLRHQFRLKTIVLST